MSPQAVVTAEGVGKRYTKYTDQPTLIGSVAWLSRRSRRDDLWALRGVEFTVARGECVGLIGANGSGKSTLLQVLAGITAPSEGRVSVRGRVAPLVSVGVGFHPELTGRENIYVNGTILGMTRAEIDQRLDDIIAFSELEEFIDTPVKFYSSGMYVRLGFTVAVHAQPDVLLVDEVLAVGDVAFQAKCSDRMDEIRERGATLIVVSHNMAQIRRLCERSLVLRAGSVVHDGDTETAIGLYHKIVAHEWRRAARDDRATVDDVVLEDANGTPVRRLQAGDTLHVRATVRVTEAVRTPVVNVQIGSEHGVRVCVVHTSPGDFEPIPAGGSLELAVDVPVLLGTGTYSVGIVVRDETLTRVGMSDPQTFFVDGDPAVLGIADLGITIQARTRQRT